MSSMNEEPLQSESTGDARPTGSLTSGMIRRRAPVRVATPEDMGGPRADATPKGAQELTARVEAAFPGDDAAPATGGEAAPMAAPEAAPGQDDAIHARQQELRRLAAERAEAQNRPLGSPDEVNGHAPVPEETPANGAAEPNGHGPNGHGPNGQGPAGLVHPAQQAQAFHQPQPPADNNSNLQANVEALNGDAPPTAPAGTRRKSLVQGGMTPLERRRAAQEHHRKLSEAQSRAANAQKRDVASYWDELRRGRQVPSVIDLDPSEIAQHWPNSLLINCNDISDHATVERSFAEVMRGAREQAAAQGEVLIEYTPMVTEWIMTVGREVARAGRPIQDIEVFPTSVGNVSYRVIALPLSGERLGDVHALCYITHA